ncbi:MAG TPA: hypothetical protein VLD38_00460 [Nitrosopumilaceae archaeon]|nr:hypothetical protein [Nitrosopumilaceae archaeon]
MNLKGILVVGFIVGIIALVVIIPNNTESPPPGLRDKPALNDSVFLKSKLQLNETPSLEDRSAVEKQSESDYYIDENGTKHHIIKANDNVKTSD